MINDYFLLLNANDAKCIVGVEGRLIATAENHSDCVKSGQRCNAEIISNSNLFWVLYSYSVRGLFKRFRST